MDKSKTGHGRTIHVVSSSFNIITILFNTIHCEIIISLTLCNDNGTHQEKKQRFQINILNFRAFHYRKTVSSRKEGQEDVRYETLLYSICGQRTTALNR